MKSATSEADNYRAACRARSGKEFFSKICIVVEEADESQFWLEVIKDSELSTDINYQERLLLEATEITKIMTKTKDTMYNKRS